MDNKNDEILNGLRNNIKSIISLYEEQKEKNREFIVKNKELTHKITNLENNIKDTESKYNTLKLAKVIGHGCASSPAIFLRDSAESMDCVATK